MKKEDAIKRMGSQSALAKLLNIKQAAVAQWGDTLPQQRIWQLMLIRPEWFKKENNYD